MRLAQPTALALVITALLGTRAWAAPSVLATIKPVHSLVAAIMRGAGTPELLIQGAQSEHSYALKPSDTEKIGRAQIVFEVGPDLETYLVRPLAALAPHATIVVLERSPGVRLLPARHGGLWEDVGNSDDGPTDPHIWLDPENAIAMTGAIAAALIKANPARAGLYSANRDRQIAVLRTLERELSGSLAPLHRSRYLVFHDAYRYFEQRFGLAPIGAVTVAPERPVGPRRVEALRRAILDGRIECVFNEPQFSPRLVETLIEGSHVRVGVLDPLGAALASGPDLYPTLLRGLSVSLKSCLGNAAKNR